MDICLLYKKKLRHMILHIETNDAVLKTFRQTLDELLQLKQFGTNMLSTCRVFMSRPTMHAGNSKAALKLSNLNKHLR